MLDDPDNALSRTDHAPLADVVMAWGRGWAVARGVPAPEEFPGGFRADVGRHGHRVRYVLHSWEPQLIEALGRQVGAPGTWIKVTGSGADLRSALPAGWTMDGAAYVMTTRFTAGAENHPRPYRIRVTTQGDVVIAAIIDPTGATAASGRMAPAGEYGIIDQVETAPAHRRRGLGTVVMRTLSAHALHNGLSTGVLVATEDGRHLYRRLGWTVRSEMAAAYVREV